MVVSLVNQTRATLVAPLPGSPGFQATPTQIMALKNHVVACAHYITQMKAKIAVSQNALAALPAADVEAAVVPGYPPPA